MTLVSTPLKRIEIVELRESEKQVILSCSTSKIKGTAIVTHGMSSLLHGGFRVRTALIPYNEQHRSTRLELEVL